MQVGKGRIQGCNNVRYKDLQAGKGGGGYRGVQEDKEGRNSCLSHVPNPKRITANTVVC